MTHASTLPHQAAPGAAHPGRRLVDAPTRMFHWLFALCFTGAWLTAESEALRSLHIMLGYSMAGLLTFRLLYGLFGPRQARLGLLWRKFHAGLQGCQTRGADLLRPLQNLALAAAVLLLMVLTVPVTLTGYGANNDWPEWVVELHEVASDAMLYLVLAHVALIIGLSLWRRRNLAGPMLTGRAPGSGPDLVRHNHGWLAVLLLAGVLGYGAWAWHQAPNGLINLSSLSSIAAEHEGDRDD